MSELLGKLTGWVQAWGSGLPSEWDRNPVIKRWRQSVQDRGGHTLPTGYPFQPYKGAPCAYWLDNGVAGKRRFELAPVDVQRAAQWERAKDAGTISAGETAETLEEVSKDLGLDKGITGFLGKVFGLPHGAVVAIAVTAGLVLGYSALVQVGIAPPLNKLTGGK